MTPQKTSLSYANYKKLSKKLFQFEDTYEPIMIGKQTLHDFVVGAVAHDDLAEPISTRTKRILLEIKGDYTTNPATLRNALQLRYNLKYNDNNYSTLQMRLDALVRPSARISDEETNACSTVGACVALVTSKTS